MATPPLIEPSDLTLDAAGQAAYASAWVRAYCGWHIAPSQDDTFTLDTDGGRLVMLPTLFMTALGDVVLTADASIIDPTLLSFSLAGMVAYKAPAPPFTVPPAVTHWPVGFQTVTMSITHGYATVPDAVKGVAVSVAKRLPAQLAMTTLETAGLVTKELGGTLGGGFGFAGLTVAEQAVLNRYRIVT